MVPCGEHGAIEGKGRKGRGRLAQESDRAQLSGGKAPLVRIQLVDPPLSAEALGRVLHPKWAILLGKFTGRLGIVLESSGERRRYAD